LVSSYTAQPSRETTPHAQWSDSPWTVTLLFSVQLREIAPSWSSDLIVPSRLPSLRAPNDHAPQSPFAESVDAENCAPSV